ncbi:nucleotidyltransferase domain-containing protein [Nanoarchaeota archaeon]
MEFEIKNQPKPASQKYSDSDIQLAYNFAKDLNKEFESFVKALVLFGSRSRKTASKKGDIDVLIIVDDVTVFLTREMIEAYRLIIQKLILKHSTRLHVTTLKFTSFWEYIRAGDPIAINMLRDGMSILDTGFFDPLQMLLRQGRIRPTTESIWSYFSRAPATLYNSKWHLLQATVDLYWAVIDSAHAVLMTQNVIPPSPDHVADMLKEHLANKGIIEKKHVKTMRDFYQLQKAIMHRDMRSVSGQDYEKHYSRAKEFVDDMRKIIEKKELPEKTK